MNIRIPASTNIIINAKHDFEELLETSKMFRIKFPLLLQMVKVSTCQDQMSSNKLWKINTAKTKQ
jgi:hypothetical protein